MRRLQIIYGAFVTACEFAVAAGMYFIGWEAVAVFYCVLGILAARITWNFRRAESWSEKTEQSGS